MTCNTVRGFFLSVSLCVMAGNNAAAWHTALTHRTHNSITSNLLQEPMFFYYPDLKKFHANIEDGSNTENHIEVYLLGDNNCTTCND